MERTGRRKIKSKSSDETLPFTAHLAELRRRLITVISSLLIFFSLFYFASDWIISEFQRPLNQKLVFIAPMEAFFAKLKVTFSAAIVFSLPVALYQIWAFIAPGLHEHEKKLGIPIVFFGTLSFLAGSCFAYYLVLPMGISFLLSFATPSIEPLISVSNYLSFLLKLILAFGMVFEYPLLVLLLSRLGLITPSFLRDKRKYAVLIMAILSAILTPPDVVSQIMMLIPLLFLYEISIFISAASFRKKR